MFVGRLPLTLIAILLISVIAPKILPDFGRQVAVLDIRPTSGIGFEGRLDDPSLSDDKQPTGARLYLVISVQGTPLHRLEHLCVTRFACERFTALLDAQFPTATHEVRKKLGPGESLHRDIWDKGEGRYSVWNGWVYFSLPADVKSIVNVTRAELRVPRRSWLEPDQVAAFFSWSGSLAALGLLAWLAVRLISRWSVFRRDILPGLAISAGILASLAIAFELYLRFYLGVFPVSEKSFPIHFVDGVGMTMVPGATAKWTNGIEFWVTEQVNSLGFLDREPALPKPPGVFRVMVIGDSFVEALQVPIKEKLQTLLKSGLEQEFPGMKFDTIGLGFSGTGQSAQIPYYERNRTGFKPDIVILLFVNNDMADNSAILESMRQGWHPDHAPFLLMRPKSCDRQPVSRDWEKFLLPGGSVPARAKQLRAMSQEIDASLGNWDPEKEDIDRVFYREPGAPLPPAFEDALASTTCAFAEWKRLAQEDGFKLVVAAVDGVVLNGPEMMGRLQPLLREFGIPLIDLYPAFRERGDVRAAHWKADPHWSATGHRWAADAILKYLVDQGMIPKR